MRKEINTNINLVIASTYIHTFVVVIGFVSGISDCGLPWLYIKVLDADCGFPLPLFLAMTTKI